MQDRRSVTADDGKSEEIMYRVLKIDGDTVFLGSADKKLLTADKADFNYSEPKVGDEVRVFKNDTIMILAKEETVQKSIPDNISENSSVSSNICVEKVQNNKASKPLYKKPWFIVLIVLLVLGIIGGSGGSDENNNSTKTPVKKVSQYQQDIEPYKPLDFDKYYRTYSENELKAKKAYGGKKYLVTAKINGLESGGLMNLTGGATLTMERQVENTVVFFTAEFESDEEEYLVDLSEGDTILFGGTLYGNFSDCKLFKINGKKVHRKPSTDE